MSMRITTNGVFHGYRRDLGNSYFRMNKSMERVTTQRNFGAYAEDVSAAARAFQVRRSHWRTCTQINNSNYVISKFETAWNAIDYIVDGEGADDNLNSIVESLRGLNSPTGAARVPLGESVLAKSESIVRLLNSQYGDQFIFAGADGKNVPFAWETDDDGTRWLSYRGIDVSTPVGMSQKEFLKHVSVEEIEDPGGGASTYKVVFDETLTKQGFVAPETEYATEADAQDACEAAFEDSYIKQFDAKYEAYTHGAVDENGNPVSAYENGRQLLEMSQEATYVDLGLGVDWDDNGDLITSSAYNSALNGLSFLGFGSTLGEDGELHSNNLAVLMQEMGNVLKACDPSTGEWPAGWDFDRVSALTRMIDTSVDNISVEHIRLSNEAAYLQTNLSQLVAQRDNLNEQILNIEQIDPADAITDYLYARYSYNAALSVGSSILMNTLLDYLR